MLLLWFVRFFLCCYEEIQLQIFGSKTTSLLSNNNKLLLKPKVLAVFLYIDGLPGYVCVCRDLKTDRSLSMLFESSTAGIELELCFLSWSDDSRYHSAASLESGITLSSSMSPLGSAYVKWRKCHHQTVKTRVYADVRMPLCFSDHADSSAENLHDSAANSQEWLHGQRLSSCSCLQQSIFRVRWSYRLEQHHHSPGLGPQWRGSWLVLLFKV